MTTLTQTWGYTCRVCDVVTSAITVYMDFSLVFMKRMLVSRQIETNHETL